MTSNHYFLYHTLPRARGHLCELNPVQHLGLSTPGASDAHVYSASFTDGQLIRIDRLGAGAAFYTFDSYFCRPRCFDLCFSYRFPSFGTAHHGILYNLCLKQTREILRLDGQLMLDRAFNQTSKIPSSKADFLIQVYNCTRTAGQF